ncbi:hypothetical protein X797_007059 [Metarhizium robertsii]|uniref:Extracellular membrane protein CFEM domain-containing protein n=1 Tax=Metarhizium robertsii TaxID=568076 RepID=A0A014N2P8_9HYPO|nr:hypothetical protein X797_007059 [Metarhizium robertsii]
MASWSWTILSWAAFGAVAVSSVDIVYVTDIEIFTYLTQLTADKLKAPCASSAISYNVALETMSTRCGDGQAALQSCICRNTSEFNHVTSRINSDISSGCGTAAGTSDAWSASRIMDKYCHPESAVAFATPTANKVYASITEIPQISYLPSCAQSGLSYAVIGEFLSKCPRDASLYAPCVCNTDRAKLVSETMSRSVRSSCSNDEDVTAAQGFFNDYCAMNSGTTSFAGPPRPPGDMTYYVTALPQFKSLRSCAQSAMSYVVQGQTDWLCGSGPQALASCICIKSGMRGKISSTLTSSVKGYCSSTAIDDVTSAVNVLDYYCSAAESKVVATVSESISESSAASVPSRTQAGSSVPLETGGAGGGANNGDKSGSGNDGNKVNKVAVIAASVLGAVVVIVLVAGLVWFFKRRSQRKQRGEQLPGGDTDARPGESDPSKYPNHGVAELSTPSHTPRPELQGNATPLPSELPPCPQHWSKSELQGDAVYGPNLRPAQPPQELLAPASGYQASPRPATPPSYSSPTNASPHQGIHAAYGYGGPQQTESYELGTRVPRS